MVNRLYKIKSNIKSSKPLRSICVGVIFFIIIIFISNILNTPICPIKLIFNKECVGCGMTRAFICILKFDFCTALQINFLSIPLFLGISIYTALTVIDIFFNKSFVIKLEKVLATKLALFVYLILFSIAIFTKYV